MWPQGFDVGNVSILYTTKHKAIVFSTLLFLIWVGRMFVWQMTCLSTVCDHGTKETFLNDLHWSAATKY